MSYQKDRLQMIKNIFEPTILDPKGGVMVETQEGPIHVSTIFSRLVRLGFLNAPRSQTINNRKYVRGEIGECSSSR